MKILTAADLVNLAAKNMNDSKDTQQKVIAFGLLQQFLQFETVSNNGVRNALATMQKIDIEAVEELAVNLAKRARAERLKSLIKEGDRVAKGHIAGIIKSDDGYLALVDGPDFHEWQRLEDIEL